MNKKIQKGVAVFLLAIMILTIVATIVAPLL